MQKMYEEMLNSEASSQSWFLFFLMVALVFSCLDYLEKKKFICNVDLSRLCIIGR